MMLTMPPAHDSDLIQPDEIKHALNDSGYLLEGRVGHALEAKAFYVETNSFRADPREEGKSIEIDVWGRFGNTFNEGNGSSVVAEALIECKNNSQPVVFFLKAQPVTEINDNHIKYAGYPQSSADPETKIHVPLHRLISMKDWHHYCEAQEIGTQFCSFLRDNSAEEKKRQAKQNGRPPLPRQDWCWKPESMEQYSKSFGSLCVATEGSGVGSFDPRQPNIQLGVYYPIIVFQGPIYAARAKDGDIDVRRTEHLQIHHSATVGGQVVRAQIDVVSEQGFPALIETIKRELERTAEGIKAIEARLLNSAIDQKEFVALRPTGYTMQGPRRGRDR
jgi:hypothetical protein